MRKVSVILFAVLILSLSIVAQPPTPGEISTDDGEESQIPVPDESVEGPEYEASNSTDLEGNRSGSNENEGSGIIMGFFKMISFLF